MSQIKYNFAGKKAIVTGASRGIGRGITLALVEAGCEVYAVSITQKNLDALKKECPKVHTICLDISDWKKTRETLEPIEVVDFLVNNAAIVEFAHLMDIEEASLDRMINSNMKAAVNITQIVAKKMIELKRGGSIVNISSIGSYRSFDCISFYGATKAALDHLTKTMAVELGPHHIRANCINPTMIKTDMSKPVYDDEEARNQFIKATPLGRLGEVCDIVGPTLFLLSDAASLVTGTTLIVDGGLLAK